MSDSVAIITYADTVCTYTRKISILALSLEQYFTFKLISTFMQVPLTSTVRIYAIHLEVWFVFVILYYYTDN